MRCSFMTESYASFGKTSITTSSGGLKILGMMEELLTPRRQRRE